MAWLTPKTDWESTDFYNLTDYNRIRGNLLYIKGFAKKFLGKVTYLKTMTEKTSYSESFTPDEVNDLQYNLGRINELTYELDIGDDTEYEKGGYTPTYEQWNRLESYTLEIRDNLIADNPNLTRLTQKLGNSDSIRGIRV